MVRDRFCELLREGVKDEADAGPFYADLIREGRQAGIPASAIDTLNEIKDDERGHLSKLKDFERRFCKR